MINLTVGVCGPHIHLSQEDWDYFFKDCVLKKEPLRNGNNFKINHRFMVTTPGGLFIEDIAVVGPARERTIIELPFSVFKRIHSRPSHIGFEETEEADPLDCTLHGGPEQRWVDVKNGLIIPRRHIHLSTATANLNGIYEGDLCSVSVETCRALAFRDVLIHVGDLFEDDFHIDTDEANASWLVNGDIVEAAI
jgi:propanediol utilization protein